MVAPSLRRAKILVAYIIGLKIENSKYDSMHDIRGFRPLYYSTLTAPPWKTKIHNGGSSILWHEGSGGLTMDGLSGALPPKKPSGTYEKEVQVAGSRVCRKEL